MTAKTEEGKKKRDAALIPPKKNEVRNPYGRWGKDKTKGFSYKQTLNKIIREGDFDFEGVKVDGHAKAVLEAVALAFEKKAHINKDGEYNSTAHLRALEALVDRIDGKPTQTNVNVEVEKTSDEEAQKLASDLMLNLSGALPQSDEDASSKSNEDSD